VIVTVPLKILQNGMIRFTPELPTHKKDAISSLGMEAGMKVFMKFNSNLFRGQNISGGAYGPHYYDASFGKEGAESILALFVTGDNAQTLSDMDGGQRISVLLQELDAMTDGQASLAYSGSAMTQDWTKEPYIQGAYSFAIVGTGNARSVLAESVDDKVFFAGEATNDVGHPSTVHGALETGLREANKVLELLK
jgi:lysine-specific histone demethylase 1B